MQASGPSVFQVSCIIVAGMKAFNLAVVTVFVLLGAGLFVLAVRVYLRTGNTAAAVYAGIIAIGSISGVIAARRNR